MDSGRLSVTDSLVPAHLRDAKVEVPNQIVTRAFAAETVILNLESGTYFGLNGSAGRMFESLQETGSVVASAHKLAPEFDVPLTQIAPDLVGFCDELLQRGLIRLT